IDAHLVRIVSLQVAITTLLLLLTHSYFVAFIILFDFTMRVCRLSQFSPFQLIGKLVMSLLDIQPRWSDESPKRFALYLGWGISSILMVVSLKGLMLFSTILALILFICTFMETLFDFCIGCKIYYFFQIAKRFFAS
ncbi:MAG: hypothetical protein RL113_1016, partial [Pseudomonadota bacterium]